MADGNGRALSVSDPAGRYVPAQTRRAGVGRPSRELVDMLGEMAMGVIPHALLRLIREPAVRPDLRRAEHAPASAQDDADRLVVVEDEGQACHGRRSRLPVAGRAVQGACPAPRLVTLYPTTGNVCGEVRLRHSDTFIAVST